MEEITSNYEDDRNNRPLRKRLATQYQDDDDDDTSHNNDDAQVDDDDDDDNINMNTVHISDHVDGERGPKKSKRTTLVVEQQQQLQHGNTAQQEQQKQTETRAFHPFRRSTSSSSLSAPSSPSLSPSAAAVTTMPSVPQISLQSLHPHHYHHTVAPSAATSPYPNPRLLYPGYPGHYPQSAVHYVNNNLAVPPSAPSSTVTSGSGHAFHHHHHQQRQQQQQQYHSMQYTSPHYHGGAHVFSSQGDLSPRSGDSGYTAVSASTSSSSFLSISPSTSPSSSSSSSYMQDLNRNWRRRSSSGIGAGAGSAVQRRGTSASDSHPPVLSIVIPPMENTCAHASSAPIGNSSGNNASQNSSQYLSLPQQHTTRVRSLSSCSSTSWNSDHSSYLCPSPTMSLSPQSSPLRIEELSYDEAPSSGQSHSLNDTSTIAQKRSRSTSRSTSRSRTPSPNSNFLTRPASENKASKSQLPSIRIYNVSSVTLAQQHMESEIKKERRKKRKLQQQRSSSPSISSVSGGDYASSDECIGGSASPLSTSSGMCPSSPTGSTVSISDMTSSLIDDPAYDQHPIRFLAFEFGLSTNPEKQWRYRDLKRSLFERISPEQREFINTNTEHSVLNERLPHKLSMISFVTRVLLLVFHFILRDGSEPRFFCRASVSRKRMESILREHDEDLYFRINPRTAFHVRELIMNSDDSDDIEDNEQAASAEPTTFEDLAIAFIRKGKDATTKIEHAIARAASLVRQEEQQKQQFLTVPPPVYGT